MFRSTLAACGILVLLALPAAATAAPGSLDPTFGTDGAVLGPLGEVRAVDRDSAGRLVAIGGDPDDWTETVTRRTAGGVLDPTFGDGGTVELPTTADAVIAVAADDSVFVGEAIDFERHESRIVHLSSSGELDPAFSADPDLSSPRAMVATPAGLLVLSVEDYVADGDLHDLLVVRRLTSTGAPDPTFGDDGSATLAIHASWGYGYTPAGSLLQVRSDGSIVVAGTLGGDVAVAGLTAAGQPLPGFGTYGVVRVSALSNGWGFPTALGVGPSGDIVVAEQGAVARLTASGAVDTSFGAGGVRTLDLGAGRATLLSGATVQADGSVLVAGSVGTDPLSVVEPPVVTPVPRVPGHRYFAGGSVPVPSPDPERAVTARLTPGGALDCSYGTSGYQRVAPVPAEGTADPLRSASNGAIFAPGRTFLFGTTQAAADHSPRQTILAVQGGGGAPAAAAAPGVTNVRSRTWYSGDESLTGWVDPRCGDVTAHFEYGPTTEYGARTADEAISAAGGPRAVDAYLWPDDLAAGEYHYRLVAEGAAGTTAGPDRSFTIIEVPPLEPNRPTPTVTTPIPPPTPAVGAVRLRSSHATLRGGKTARLAVQCRGGACKRVTVTLRTGRTTLATGQVSLASGKSGYVTVRLTAAGRKAAKRHRSLKTTALLGVTGGKTVKAAVTITSPKPKKAKKKTTKKKAKQH